MFIKLYLISCIGMLVSIFSLSCSLKGNPPGIPEVVDMRINHYQQTGIGEGLYLVYLVQEGENIGGEDWSYLYDEVEGFKYEPGYVYDIKVRKVEVENPPADASSIKYILVNVRSKEKVPENETFEIDLKKYEYSFVNFEGDEMFLLYKYLIDCNSMCDELINDLESQEKVTATFIHGPDESLILQSYE